MTESRHEKRQFVLRLGDLRKSLAAGESYTIGKETSCDVRLGHGTVSPIHCRLQVTDEEVIVRDLDSLGGTKIDGEAVMTGTWTPGRILEIGAIRIELEVRSLEPVPLTAAEAAAAFGFGPQTPPVSQRPEPTFGEVMAGELERAPWFGLSLVTHVGLFLILWIFAEREVPLGSETLTFSMEKAEAERDFVEETIVEEVIVEQEMEDPVFSETEIEMERETEDSFIDESDFVAPDSGFGNADDLMTKVSGSGLGDILKAGKGSLSGKFKKTVAGLRKNGLEIMFVFDSTGSMGTVLQAAKDRMERMVSVLLELVPYARIGVITYRDRGESEDYLTRHVALSRDLYRSINFLQLVVAGGGGDEPEAVYDALALAIKQKWSPTARRLVILIGDAPPHKHEQGRISSMVRNFSRNDRSFVHAIITRPSGRRDIAKVTEKTFQRIAHDGRGEALAFEDEGKILKAVMRLAFGKDSRSLDEIYRLADIRAKSTAPRAVRLLKRSNLAAIRREFAKPVVPHDVIKAILQAPSAAVLNELVDIAGKRSFNAPGRHAAAYILKQLAHLDAAPVDPEKSDGLSAAGAERLKKHIGREFK